MSDEPTDPLAEIDAALDIFMEVKSKLPREGEASTPRGVAVPEAQALADVVRIALARRMDTGWRNDEALAALDGLLSVVATLQRGYEDVPEAQARLKAWTDDFSVGPRDWTPYANPGELKADIRGLLSVVATLQEEIRLREESQIPVIPRGAADKIAALEARVATLQQERDEAISRGHKWAIADAERKAELVAVRERETQLREALYRLFSAWDDSVDSLGPEWVALGERIEAVRAALVVSSPPPGEKLE